MRFSPSPDLAVGSATLSPAGRGRTLVIDTATANCSVALIEAGVVIAAADDRVGRGHAERLVPMIATLPDGGRASWILVDVGPGSFTGIRVGIAAARGLALGWNAGVSGYTSLSLIAARALADDPSGPLAAVLEGGHGEVFMQLFASPPGSPPGANFAPLAPFRSLGPDVARGELAGVRAIGDGLRWLGTTDPRVAPPGALPHAADAVLLPQALTILPPSPLYGRAPDAKVSSGPLPPR